MPDLEPEMTLEPMHDEYPADDDRLVPHVDDLKAGLKDERVHVTVRTTAEPDKRGGSAEIVLALGSSGIVSACLMALKAWLDRDKARKIKVKVRDRKTKRDVEFTADAANLRELERILRELERILR